MTPQQLRSAVSTAVRDWADAYSDPDNGIAPGTLPVFYENGPEAEPSALRVWVDVELRFYGSNLVSVGRQDGRYTGAIWTAVYIKAGEGTQIPDRILESLTKLLRARHFGPGAYTKYPERSIPPSPSFYGWHRAALMTPFVLTEKASDLT